MRLVLRDVEVAHAEREVDGVDVVESGRARRDVRSRASSPIASASHVHRRARSKETSAAGAAAPGPVGARDVSRSPERDAVVEGCGAIPLEIEGDEAEARGLDRPPIACATSGRRRARARSARDSSRRATSSWWRTRQPRKPRPRSAVSACSMARSFSGVTACS
jgi:hypothetical protein